MKAQRTIMTIICMSIHLVFFAQSDHPLYKIEGKIMQAFINDMRNQNNAELQAIDEQLFEMQKEKEMNLLIYWRAYTNYYASIASIKSGDKKTAEKRVEEAIDLLDDMENKTAEEYALLAMMEGYSIQFNNLKAMFISMSAQNNAERALEIDSTNIRANYVYGSNDFYTPEKYGGGKVAAHYLSRATQLPSQSSENPFLPSWGKEQAYELLIKFHLRKNEKAAAVAVYKQGIEEFPNSYTIHKVASKIID